MQTSFALVSFLSLFALGACGPASELSLEGDASPAGNVGESQQAVLAGAGPGGEQVVFLNFEGGVLLSSGGGADNPQANRSALVNTTKQLPAYQPPASLDRQASIDSVLDQLRSLYAGYRVLFTTTRPASLPYAMVMVGGRPQHVGMAASITGISPLDCGNVSSNVALVFSEAIEHAFEPVVAEDTLRREAIVIAHETAHSFGLEHSADPTDVMAPSVTELDVAFRGPAPTSLADSGVCGGNDGSIARLAALVGLVEPPAPEPSVPSEPSSHPPRGNGKKVRECAGRLHTKPTP